MATIQLADHLADDVVQVQTSLGIRDEHLVFCLDRIPIHPVHIRQVETVAVSPPCFIENLRPFLRVIDRDLHVRQVHRIAQVCFSRRDIRHINIIALKEERFLAAGFDTHLGAIGNHILFLLFQIVHFRAAASPVINFIPIRVEVAIIGRAHRQFDDAVRNTVEVDLDNRSGSFFFPSLLLLCRSVFLRFIFGHGNLRVLFHKRRRSVFGKQCEINPVHIIIDMVPFQRSVGRIEIAGGCKDQIFAIRAEDWGRGVIPFIRNRIFFLAGKIVNINNAVLVIPGTGISQPLVIRREGHATRFAHRVLQQGCHLFGSDIQQVQAVLAVCINDLFRIRTPFESADIGVVILSQPDRFAASGILHIEFRLSGCIRNIDNESAVGRPLRIAVMRSRRTGDVLCHPLLHRQVEHFATGSHH